MSYRSKDIGLMGRAGVGLVVLAGLGFAGCATTGERERQMRDRAEIERLRSETARLRDHMESSSAGRQDMYGQMEATRRAQDERIDRLESRVAGLERSLRALESGRATDRKEIVDQLSKKISGVMRSQSTGGGSYSDTGVEHTVQPGETLSEIASAYNVRIDVLIRANGLKNPNSIRVGQKLFIPD